MGDPSGIWRSNDLQPTPWDVTSQPMSLPAMFDASVAAHPGSPLLDFFGRIDSKAVLETERDLVQARVVMEQVGGERVKT